MSSIASLKVAVRRYAKSPSHLTSIHYIFVKQCLLAKCYEEALEILETPIDDLDLEVFDLLPKLISPDGFALSTLSSIFLLWMYGIHRLKTLPESIRVF
jgi:hypothetical protein